MRERKTVQSVRAHFPTVHHEEVAGEFQQAGGVGHQDKWTDRED